MSRQPLQDKIVMSPPIVAKDVKGTEEFYSKLVLDNLSGHSTSPQFASRPHLSFDRLLELKGQNYHYEPPVWTTDSKVSDLSCSGGRRKLDGRTNASASSIFRHDSSSGRGREAYRPTRGIAKTLHPQGYDHYAKSAPPFDSLDFPAPPPKPGQAKRHVIKQGGDFYTSSSSVRNCLNAEQSTEDMMRGGKKLDKSKLSERSNVLHMENTQAPPTAKKGLSPSVHPYASDGVSQAFGGGASPSSNRGSNQPPTRKQVNRQHYSSSWWPGHGKAYGGNSREIYPRQIPQNNGVRSFDRVFGGEIEKPKVRVRGKEAYQNRQKCFTASKQQEASPSQWSSRRFPPQENTITSNAAPEWKSGKAIVTPPSTGVWLSNSWQNGNAVAPAGKKHVTGHRSDPFLLRPQS